MVSTNSRWESRNRSTFNRESLQSNTPSELAREKMWARIHLIPLLQAEEDRDQIRRHFADAERQKALTGSDDGFKLGKGDYHKERSVQLEGGVY
jgi:hypothetical protein